MTDFSKTLIRASAIGHLFVEPKSAEDKKAGNLSQTAKDYLIKAYIKAKYDRETDIATKHIQKGIEAEESSIMMLSKHQGKMLFKNEERLSNEWVTGLPDVYEGESIENCDFLWDIKTSWDIWTFLGNIRQKLNPIYYYQMQAYLWLSNCKSGAIAYCLTDCPENIIQDEKRKLLYKMNVISEDSPEFIEEAAKMEINLIYPDIPIDEKILIFPVERDEEVIELMKQKVQKAREFLTELEKKHCNFNK